MHTEYLCEGCAIRVINFGRPAPSHGLCALCAWCNEHETPERLMDLRRRCEPGGWVSEREQRKATIDKTS